MVLLKAFILFRMTLDVDPNGFFSAFIFVSFHPCLFTIYFKYLRFLLLFQSKSTPLCTVLFRMKCKSDYAKKNAERKTVIKMSALRTIIVRCGCFKHAYSSFHTLRLRENQIVYSTRESKICIVAFQLGIKKKKKNYLLL